MDYLISLPGWMLGFIFVISGVCISITGLFAVRKIFPRITVAGEQIRPAAAICHLIGALFAILLAFVVVNVWSRYNEQKTRLVMEACVLANLYRDCKGLGVDQEKDIQLLTKKYTQSLIENAWPLLEKGKESRDAWVNYNELYFTVVNYEPKDAKQQMIRSRLVDHLNELANFRRLRLLNAKISILPNVFWLVLTLGAGISIGFTYFFSVGTLKMQVLMTSLHATLVSLMFYMIALLNYPYKSSIKVSPEPLENLLEEVYPLTDTIDVSRF